MTGGHSLADLNRLCTEIPQVYAGDRGFYNAIVEGSTTFSESRGSKSAAKYL